MKIHHLALCGGLLVSTSAMADPLTLTGKYLYVGISDAGTFGSNGNNQPGLQHDPTGMGNFDPNHDYVSPGSPHDGFSLISDQFGFSQNDNHSPYDFGFASPSILAGPDAMGFAHAATWSGGNNFAQITNSYFFNDGDQRVLVKTTITALSDLTNLAFARSVDPDPDNAAPFFNPDTKNQRGNSLYGVDDFVGSAGANSGLTLALVNIDAAGLTHTTSIQGDCCDNINPYEVLGHAGGDQGLASVGDHGLNLAYLIGVLSSGSSVTLTYSYSVGDNIDVVGPPTGAVPEPATWAMMLGGFGAVGGALRSRRRTSISFG
jgi:hypothetical protein